MADDGGPAYPVRLDAAAAYTGMTLRDYFAAAALTGLVAGVLSMADKLAHDVSHEDAAKDAWIFADAMLETRDG